MATTAGIDIGSEAIKGVVLKAVKKNGPIEVVAAGTMPIGDLTRMPESEDRTFAIGEKLRELVKSARIRADNRRMGASGGNTSIRYLQIPPVPPWRLEMLVKYEVEERSEEKEPNCSDFHIMDVPETNGNYTVIIGMCRDVLANELLKEAKAASLGEVEIDLEALALYAAYYHGHGFDSDKTVAVADIGADDITVLICKNGALFYARTVMGGGRRFTQNLADDLKLDWAEADELKRTTAEIVFDVAPSAASSTGRPRLQRPGGLGQNQRPGATARPGSLPGVNPAEPGASGVARSGIAPAAGASGSTDEARRARIADGAKLVSRHGVPGSVAAGGAGASQSRAGLPGASSAGQSGAAPSADAAAGDVGQKAPAPGMKLSNALDFAMLDLDSDLTQSVKPEPAAPKIVAPAMPVASPKPVAAAPAAIDEFELQPNLEPTKKEGPVSRATTVPAASPSVAIGTGNMPTTPATAPVDNDILLDLGSTPDTVKTTPNNSAVATVSAQDALDQALSTGAVALPDDTEKRKRQTTAALVREAASLCAAIENVLMNCKQQTKQGALKLDRLYITGGGSKLKGLAEFMNRRLRVEVAALEPLKNISLDRLAPQAAAALREEQHTLSVALGLALSDLRPGTFNFQLLPQVIKDRQAFWARGAYHYYAAGAAALALGLLVYTPYVNTDALGANYEVADKAFRDAKTKNDEVKKLEKENDELRHRLKTITDNIQSGDYFLTLLAELKSKNRIYDDLYLTSVSTQIPNVVIAEADTAVDVKAIDSKKEPDTFQAQRRIYLRGFATGKQESMLIKPIQDFYDRLVPFPNEPDDPRNLFKDIRPIWYSKGENMKDGLYLKEFVLEAYTAAPQKAAKPEKKASAVPGVKNSAAKQPSGAIPAGPTQPVITAPVPAPVPVPAQPVVPPIAVPAQAVAPAQAMIPQPVPVNPAQPAVPAPAIVPPQVAPIVPAQPVVAAPVVVPQPVPAVPAQPEVPVVKRKPVYVVPDAPPPAPRNAVPNTVVPNAEAPKPAVLKTDVLKEEK